MTCSTGTREHGRSGLRISELVSEWELEEIRQELASGDAPDIVAFRHGISKSSVRELAKTCHRRHTRKWDDVWTDAEIAFVRDNYPSHGKRWCGWEMLDRTWDAIRMRAHIVGVRRRAKELNENWRRTNGKFFGKKGR